MASPLIVPVAMRFIRFESLISNSSQACLRLIHWVFSWPSLALSSRSIFRWSSSSRRCKWEVSILDGIRLLLWVLSSLRYYIILTCKICKMRASRLCAWSLLLALTSLPHREINSLFMCLMSISALQHAIAIHLQNHMDFALVIAMACQLFYIYWVKQDWSLDRRYI